MPTTRGSTKRKKAEAEEKAEAAEGAPPTPKKKKMSKEEKKAASARAEEAMSHKSPASPSSYVKKQETTTKKKAPSGSKKTGASSRPPRPKATPPIEDPCGLMSRASRAAPTKSRASRAPSLASTIKSNVKQPTSAIKKPRAANQGPHPAKVSRVTFSEDEDDDYDDLHRFQDPSFCVDNDEISILSGTDDWGREDKAKAPSSSTKSCKTKAPRASSDKKVAPTADKPTKNKAPPVVVDDPHGIINPNKKQRLSPVPEKQAKSGKLPALPGASYNNAYKSNDDDTSVSSTNDWDGYQRTHCAELVEAHLLNIYHLKNKKYMKALQIHPTHREIWGPKYGNPDNYKGFHRNVSNFFKRTEQGKNAVEYAMKHSPKRPDWYTTKEDGMLPGVSISFPPVKPSAKASLKTSEDDDDLAEFAGAFEFTPSGPVLPPAPATPPRKGTITVSEQRLSTAQKKRKMEYDQSVFEFAQAKAAMAQKNMDEVKEKQAQIVDEVGANCKGLRDGNRILGEQSQVSGKYFESSSANAAMEVSAFAELQKSKCDYENAAEELALMEGKDKENKEQSSNGNSGGGIMAKLGFGYK